MKIINYKNFFIDIAPILFQDSEQHLTLDISAKHEQILQNLFILNEYIPMVTGFNTIIVDILLLISIICAIYTILSKNPIISVLYLIGLYVSVASYLLIVGANFIALAYLLIYIGAISILFIFILMLINIRISELLSNSRNSIPLVIIVTILINNMLYSILPSKYILYNMFIYDNDYNHFLDKFVNFYKSEIFNISSVNWDSNILEHNNIKSLGNIMYTSLSILLILASIILLLAMVGAIIITIKSPDSNLEKK